MDNDDHVTKFETIQSLNAYLGIESSNEFVSVIDLSEIDNVTHVVKYFGLYCVTCVFDDESEEHASRLYFIRPGQYGRYSSGVMPKCRGWILSFHPSLLQGTLLANRMSEYTFFSESLPMPLYLDEEQTRLVDNCMRSLRAEQYHEIDHYSKRILASGIAVLLSQCMRFSYKQIGNASIRNSDIVRRVDILLNDHFSSPTHDKVLPTVAWCADKLQLSPNYFGDLMRKHGGIAAQEHIHRRIVEEIKTYLERDKCSIGHIADKLGFKHPHHLSRLFRKAEGCTPMEYRHRLLK
jgi:AraC-like DNA-binding protein